jgi:threonylcarbamoyladenosine tRNA methylthiotransferase MtaB
LKANPDARVVVTGCYAQIASQELVEMTDCRICIVGNGYKDRLVEIALSGAHCDLEMHMGDIGRRREICSLPVCRFEGRTRAYLKVQDGCNSFCSYCIVPYARGRSRSLRPEKVMEQAAVFVEQGYREIVLTGIHLGHYGLDLGPDFGLVELLRVLAAENHPLRYRLSSLEPTEISDRLLSLIRDSASIMPYLHIPLQSGSDEILKKMNRRYGAEKFVAVVENSVRQLPGVAIGVDVLVGFPGESDADFQRTIDLLESLPVAYLHVFPYSRRPGTVAATLPGQLPKKVKEERVALLRILDHKKRIAFYEQNLGSIQQVLVEGRRGNYNELRGFSGNYIPVFLEGHDDSMLNTIVPVELVRISENGIRGKVCQPNVVGRECDDR